MGYSDFYMLVKKGVFVNLVKVATKCMTGQNAYDCFLFGGSCPDFKAWGQDRE